MKLFTIEDYIVLEKPHTMHGEVIDYGVKMSGAPLEWAETQGEGIKVGIIDTGIDLDHEDLHGRVAEYYNFITSDSKNVFDDNGHGTHVAGIIAANRNGVGVIGVAPKCELYVAKAFDSEGKGEPKNVANAIQWLLSKRVNAINMSFTTKEYISDYSYLIKKCYSQSILCVCAAGNDGVKHQGSDTIEYPARFPETVAVTAVDINKKIADFSSAGPRADIAAAGKNILSTYPGNMYMRLSGTSMAAPIITGAVAIIQAKAKNRFKRFLTPTEVKLILDMYTDDLGSKGRDKQYGYGVFTFGRIGTSDVIKHNTAYNNSSQFQQNRNPYSNIFNNTMLLKMMGFHI